MLEKNQTKKGNFKQKMIMFSLVRPAQKIIVPGVSKRSEQSEK